MGVSTSHEASGTLQYCLGNVTIELLAAGRLRMTVMTWVMTVNYGVTVLPLRITVPKMPRCRKTYACQSVSHVA
jgi:hypothetical protein